MPDQRTGSVASDNGRMDIAPDRWRRNVVRHSLDGSRHTMPTAFAVRSVLVELRSGQHRPGPCPELLSGEIIAGDFP